MWSNLLKWLENLWKLKEIFDKYLPEIRAHKEAILEAAVTLRKLKTEIETLKAQQAANQSAVEATYLQPTEKA